MSDDTPTQRLPQPGGDTPTERIDTGGTAPIPGTTGGYQEDLREEKQRSRGLLVGLIIAGVLLVVALIVLLIILLPKGQDDPVVVETPAPTETTSPLPSETPEATPDPEPTTEPEPPSTAVAIDSFAVSNTTVRCNTQAPGGPFNQYISFSWKTSNADSIVIGTYDPYGTYSGYYYNLPPDGNTNDLGLQITYGCPEPSQKWRLEVTGGGQTIKQEITIVNEGDTQ